jgi:large subunit ribosomal protein L17
MRHRNKGRILGRTKSARELMLRNLATSLVLYEKVRTTEAKAKEVRPLVERMITTGRRNTLTSRRALLKVLTTPGATKKVLEVLGPRYEGRNGGYTRIVKLGPRQGDAAPMVQIEFV